LVSVEGLGHLSVVNFLSALFSRNVSQTSDSFESDGQRITVDVFAPYEAGPHPVLIALHGSGGMEEGWANEPASLLAGRGFVVCVLHYFERTGTVWANDATIRANFETWMKTISDAITWAGTRADVDVERVGVLGFSLGAYLALSVAAVDARVKAVVDYFGGLPGELAEHAHKIAPTLILHGERDYTVPVSEAHKLKQLFEQTGTDYEMKLYPNAGHGFSGMDMFDAGQRTFSFLERTLKT
jgi:carboxymethylenebutenolidase